MRSINTFFQKIISQVIIFKIKITRLVLINKSFFLRLRTDQEKQGFWPYEAESVLRDENESIDSYNMSQEFESENNHKSYYRVSSLEREMQSNTRRYFSLYIR